MTLPVSNMERKGRAGDSSAPPPLLFSLMIRWWGKLQLVIQLPVKSMTYPSCGQVLGESGQVPDSRYSGLILSSQDQSVTSQRMERFVCVESRYMQRVKKRYGWCEGPVQVVAWDGLPMTTCQNVYIDRGSWVFFYRGIKGSCDSWPATKVRMWDSWRWGMERFPPRSICLGTGPEPRAVPRQFPPPPTYFHSAVTDITKSQCTILIVLCNPV